MKRVFVIFMSLMMAFAFLTPAGVFEGGEQGSSAYAADSNVLTDGWVRILRDYTEPVTIGKYSYYYELNTDGDWVYRVYRENMNTGKRKLLKKITLNNSPYFYTNGETFIYAYYKLGTIIKAQDIATGKTRTLVDLSKYKTSKSTDTTLHIHLNGKYLYYSKYRGLSTMIYKLYRVNINTGASKILYKTCMLTGPMDGSYVSGRYCLVKDKSGNYKIYDTKGKTMKKLAGSSLKRVNYIGGKWYYVTSSKSGSTYNYKVFTRAESGSGTSKKIAAFSKKYKPDDIIEITNKGVFFLVNDDYSMEYVFSTKKTVKRKDRDVWYYIGFNQRYM